MSGLTKDSRSGYSTGSQGLKSNKITKKKMSVLLIEDDPIFRDVLCELISQANIKVEAYESIADLGSFSKIGTFDLAIVDCHLPIMKGFEIAKYVDTFFANLPIVLMSADSGIESNFLESKERMPVCVREFIPKDSGVEQIVEHVMRVIDSLNAESSLGYDSESLLRHRYIANHQSIN